MIQSGASELWVALEAWDGLVLQALQPSLQVGRLSYPVVVLAVRRLSTSYGETLVRLT